MTDHSPAGLPLPLIEPFTDGGFKQVLTKVGLRAARSYTHRIQGARATRFEQVGLEPDRLVLVGDNIVVRAGSVPEDVVVTATSRRHRTARVVLPQA